MSFESFEKGGGEKEIEKTAGTKNRKRWAKRSGSVNSCMRRVNRCGNQDVRTCDLGGRGG